jgi:FixJ family two-component response regulator
MQPRGLVAVIDDEALVRKALERLLRLEDLLSRVMHRRWIFYTQSMIAALTACCSTFICLEWTDSHCSSAPKMAVKMPAIVISADCSPPVIHRARSLGALQCLSKPVDASILMDAISAVLRTSRK